MKVLYSLGLLVGASLPNVHAQVFTEVNAGLIKPSELGYSSWCDINNDGYLDLFITGFNLAPHGGSWDPDFKHSLIYINDKNGSFIESQIKNIPRAIYGGSSWGDLNNDGWADLVITGTVSGHNSDGVTYVYLNNKNETFSSLDFSLPPVTSGQTMWLDYDNDGWQDLFLMGFTVADEMIMKIFKNANGESLHDSGVEFNIKKGGNVNLGRNGCAMGDFDNDTDTDLIVGYTTKGGYSIDLYENQNSSFVRKNITLPQYSYATIAVADFNKDGNLDLVLNGITEGSTSNTYATKAHFTVLTGDGHLNFNILQNFENQGTYWGSVNAGDLNNDGLPDVVINGTGNGMARTLIYINNNGSGFTRVDAGLAGTLLGEANCADYDYDGDLDMLVTGSVNSSASTAQARLYRNDTPGVNTRPAIPTNLRIKYDGVAIRLEWDESSDKETPSQSLSYNVRIGETVTGNQFMSSLSNSDGTRQVEQLGNAGLNTFQKIDNKINRFFWQVQALDAAYYESGFSEPQEGCIAPPPSVAYNSHYCYNDHVRIVSEEGPIEVYDDENMENLLWTGSEIEFPATSSRTLFAIQKATGCLSIPTEIKYSVSNLPELTLFSNDEPVESDTILLIECTEGQTFPLRLESNYLNVSWEPQSEPQNEAGNLIYVENTGAITARAEDAHGCITEKKVIIDIAAVSDLFVPNVITPNGDLKNDLFFVKTNAEIALTIMNRYGTAIFQTTNYQNDFDGSGLSAGTYFYELKTRPCEQRKKGSLHIIH